MKSVKILQFGAAAMFLFFAASSAIGQERPGIECGCNKYEDYVPPACKNLLVEEGEVFKEGFSAKTNPRYRLFFEPAAPPNLVHLSVFKDEDLIYDVINMAVGWGFSPDQDRFAMYGTDQSGNHWCSLMDLNPDPSQEGEWASNILDYSQGNVSSANICFSPHGKYLVYAAINATTGGLNLKVFDTNVGSEVYQFTVNHIVGAARGKHTVGWGFSPDVKDATFLHSFLVDINRYALYVVNLTKDPYEYVFSAPSLDNSYGFAQFLFSPCGDYFAWRYDNDFTLPSCRLYRTDLSGEIGPINADNFVKLYTASDGHYMKYLDGTYVKIVDDNTADNACSDNVNPTWGAGKSLSTGVVEGVKMELIWDGASDASGVTGYRIFKVLPGNVELLKEIEAVNSCYVTGLSPSTPYTFRIEAGDETGNWSTDGPEETFNTANDNEPYWNDLYLDFSLRTETNITLNWHEAGDDFGIKYYRIMEDGEELCRVGKDTLKCRIKGLTASNTYNFTVEAGDESNQRTPGGQLTTTMPSPVDPEWGAGAALSDSAVTETSLIVKWPVAEDNFNSIKGYSLSMDGDTLINTWQYTSEYQISDLEAGTIYSFEVTAYDESGNATDPPLTADFSTLASFAVDTLVSGPGDQKHPDIDGNMVVWWDDSMGAGDIFSYDLATDKITRVTDEPHTQFDPVVSGERIVWTDNRNGDWDIYMYDPDLGEVPVCTASGSQDLPDIDGDIIVWRDGRNGNFDIYMYDINTQTESPVSTRSSAQNWPTVSGYYIVYADDRKGNWDIYMYNTVTKKETAICTNSGDQTFPTITRINYRQLAIAFMDDRLEQNIYILYPNFLGGDTDFEYLVPLDPPPFISPQAYPHFADKQLVYQDLLGANDGIHWSIYAYQFAYDSPSPADIRKEISVSSWASQTNPRTSKGNIVWEYEQDNNTDIHIWKRPPGSDLMLHVTELTDPVMVGDTLKYQLRLINNGPKNNSQIKTTSTLPLMAKYVSATTDKGVVVAQGNTVIWNIDTLRFEEEASLEITLLTFEQAVLTFTAEVKGKSFELDPASNMVNETTRVKNVFSRFVDEGGMPAMVVEDGGRVHLAYFRNDTLVYASKNRSDKKWEYRTLGFCASSNNVSMVMAPDRSLHIIYSDYNWDGYPESRLYHGVFNPLGNWSSRIIALSGAGFHSLSPDFASDGELYLAYQEAHGVASPGAFMIRRTVNGAWQEEKLVFEEGYDHIDLDVDNENNVHLSFYNLSQGAGILYQKWDNNLAGPVEKIETKWRGGQMEGMVTSVEADSLSMPHISYVGNVNTDYKENIKHAWKKDDTWHIQKVDNGSFGSSGNQIGIGPKGDLNFGYYHHPENQVRFSSNIAGPWIRQVVDEEDKDFGWDLEMAMDKDGYGHIASPGVKYALIPRLIYFHADPDTLNFGAVEPGSSKTLILKLSNPSEQEITIDNVKIDDPRFSFSKTSFSLGRFEEDSIEITFNQAETLGVDKWLRIDYNYPAGLMMEIPVIVKGWQPELTCNPASVNFGSVPKPSTETRIVILENTGATDLIFSDINVKMEFMPGYEIETDFFLDEQTCSTLQPGQSCEATIGFSPTRDTPQASYLNISSNDPITPLKKVSISGRSSVPQIYPASNIIDFGYCPQGQSIMDTVILINGGAEELTIYGSTIVSGVDSDQFSVSGACSSISPGDSCFLQLTMTPTKQGDLSAQLRITSNSQYSNILTVSLKGTSFLRSLELSTDLINFGSVHVGEKSPVLLELRNTGSTDISISSLVPVSGRDRYEFYHNFDNAVCDLLSPGVTCIDTVWFMPVYEGAKQAELIISSNDSYHPEQTVVLTGQAGTILPIQATISADPQAGQEPLSVQLQSVTTGGQAPYSYYWDFDDMRFSMDPAPIHEFSSFGSYNVSVVVSDIAGNSVTKTTQVNVAQEGVPVVIAEAVPDYGEIPLTVQFNATVTAGDAPYSFLWEFRDGSTSNQQNPVHGFSFPGNYRARVTVTDNDGDTGKDSVLVTAIWNNSISGDILDESGIISINKSIVLLFPENSVEPTMADTLDGSNTYLFPGLENGLYTVQAIPDPTAYPQDLPTYLGDKITMYEATRVDASGHLTDKDIKLIKKPSSASGSGAISGELISDQGIKGLTVVNKSDFSKGTPLANINIYLKSTTDGSLIAYDITDPDGSFSFEGLENGSYYLVVDYQGKPMDNSNAPLVLSDGEHYLEIMAVVGISNITVVNITTSVLDYSINQIRIYPVPAGDDIMIDIPEDMFRNKSVRIRILDFSGKYLYSDRNFEITGYPVSLNLDFLDDGIYILNITDNDISHWIKILKIN